jgi:hypothetical protein
MYSGGKSSTFVPFLAGELKVFMLLHLCVLSPSLSLQLDARPYPGVALCYRMYSRGILKITTSRAYVWEGRERSLIICNSALLQIPTIDLKMDMIIKSCWQGFYPFLNLAKFNRTTLFSFHSNLLLIWKWHCTL